jgi:hypothetical protein
MAHNPKIALPPGWTRRQVPKLSYYDGAPTFLFYHESLGPAGFPHPLPVANSPLEVSIDNWSPFLLFSIQQSTFVLGESFKMLPWLDEREEFA